jgi:hypothetical protein
LSVPVKANTILMKRLAQSGKVFFYSVDSSGRKRHGRLRDRDTELILVRLGWTIAKARQVVASLTEVFRSEEFRLDRFQEVFLTETLDSETLRDLR